MLRCAAAYILAMALHEAAHLIAARCCGLTIREVRLTPMGVRAHITGFCGVSAAREALVYASGPLANILAAGILLACGCTDMLFMANAALACVNLLPALPLDGGQILQTLLCSRLPPVRAARALSCFGAALGVCIAAAALALRLNFTFVVFSALLTASNIAQIKRGGFPASAVVRKLASMPAGPPDTRCSNGAAASTRS